MPKIIVKEKSFRITRKKFYAPKYMKLKENSKTLLLEFISLARLSLNSVAAYLSQSQQILTGS